MPSPGQDLKICKDSKILSSISLDEVAQTLLMSTLVEHSSEWSRTTECGGLVRETPDRKLTPACSATLVQRVRVVMPTYSDVQKCTQLYLYTKEDRKCKESLSL